MTRLLAATIVVIVSACFIGCNAPSNRAPVVEAPGRDADPRADDAQNVRLVGYNDLQGLLGRQAQDESDNRKGGVERYVGPQR